jgi:hypothetical protein
VYLLAPLVPQCTNCGMTMVSIAATASRRQKLHADGMTENAGEGEV